VPTYSVLLTRERSGVEASWRYWANSLPQRGEEIIVMSDGKPLYSSARTARARVTATHYERDEIAAEEID